MTLNDTQKDTKHYLSLDLEVLEKRERIFQILQVNTQSGHDFDTENNRSWTQNLQNTTTARWQFTFLFRIVWKCYNILENVEAV